MTTDAATPLKLGTKVSYLPYLTEALGNFAAEGLDVSLLDKPELKAAAAAGERIPAQVNWYHHAVFSAATEEPLVAVMVLHDAPGITVMVPNAHADEIRSGADFAGRRIAEGASRSAKGIITNYLAVRSGLPKGSYTPVLTVLEGRREAVLQGLQDGTVDVLTFMEPMTGFVKDSGLVSTLYDITTRDEAINVFGAPWPAECLLVSRDLLDDEPDVVGSLVNAFVRTMQFIATSTPEAVLAALPHDYVERTGRDSVAKAIANRWPTIARDSYSVEPASADLMVAAAKSAPFDETESGQKRALVVAKPIDPVRTYDNRFVHDAHANVSV
jgi:NitT/TauT family transport system substrate-binding protein